MCISEGTGGIAGAGERFHSSSTLLVYKMLSIPVPPGTFNAKLFFNSY